MVGRGIITPKNADVVALNDQALQKFPEQSWFPMARIFFAANWSAPILQHKWKCC